MFFADFTIPTLSFLYTNYELWLFWNKRMNAVHALCASIIWNCLWGPGQLVVWLFSFSSSSEIADARLVLVFFLLML